MDRRTDGGQKGSPVDVLLPGPPWGAIVVGALWAISMIALPQLLSAAGLSVVRGLTVVTLVMAAASWPVAARACTALRAAIIVSRARRTWSSSPPLDGMVEITGRLPGTWSRGPVASISARGSAGRRLRVLLMSDDLSRDVRNGRTERFGVSVWGLGVDRGGYIVVSGPKGVAVLAG